LSVKRLVLIHILHISIKEARDTKEVVRGEGNGMRELVLSTIVLMTISIGLLSGCTTTTTEYEFGWDTWDVQY
jgi:hypothetical protein